MAVESSLENSGRRAGLTQSLLLLLGSCLPVLGAVLLAPVLPRMQAHFADVAGSTVLVPIVLTLPALMIALLAPFAGVIADRLGRKPLLLIGSVGMALTLAIMAFCFSQGELVNNKLTLPDGYGAIAFYAAISYAALFNLSWGPVMWVLLGEMFPNQMRGSALAVAGFAQWTSNFLITLSFPWALKNLGLTTAYSFFTLCAFISVFFVASMVRETKGKTLEEMQG